MTLRMYANRKKLPLDDVNITLRHYRLHGEDCEQCDSDMLHIDVIDRDIELIGGLTEEQRQSLLKIADKCPVHKTLEGKLSIKSRLS